MSSEVKTEPGEVEVCASCLDKNGGMKCANCESEYYCSKECQKDHWPSHKRICKQKVFEKNISERTARICRDFIKGDCFKSIVTAMRKKKPKGIYLDLDVGL